MQGCHGSASLHGGCSFLLGFKGSGSCDLSEDHLKDTEQWRCLCGSPTQVNGWHVFYFNRHSFLVL